MTMKSLILAGTAGLILSTAVAGIPSASADTRKFDGDYSYGRSESRGHRGLPRVTAQGAALSPYKARMEAVHKWRDKVADRFGYQFSYWWQARDKDVDCRKVADDDPSWDNYGRRGIQKFDRPRHYEPVTRCTVSAIPSRGWGYGFYSR